MSQFFSTLNESRLSEILGRSVASFTLDEVDLEKLNNSSSLRFATVNFVDGTQTSIVIKIATASPMSKLHGLAREAYFFQQWPKLEVVKGARCEIASFLPKVYHSEGSMEDGTKELIMEDLSATSVQSGYLYGPGNPNNWGKDLDALTQKMITSNRKELPSVAEVTRLAFLAAAKLHAPYWCCSSIVDQPSLSWLRGSAWLNGRSAEMWAAVQDNTAKQWAQVKAKIESGTTEVRWEPLLVACVDAAISKASSANGGWDKYQAELRSRPFTLVHGDFHPANILLVNNNNSSNHDDSNQEGGGGADNDQRVVLVDWEACGLGSGPQELGQFMISHTAPSIRATIERESVQAYYAELTRLNPHITMTFEECWHEYVMGGLGRWLFFLPFDGWGSVKVSQYFCDQVYSFIVDHHITPENVPMPRV